MSDMRLILHGLAIKKHGSAADVAELMGLDPATVEGLLAEAEARGRVAKAGAKYMLTAPAQMVLSSEYSRLYADQRDDKAMNAAYDEFEKVNAQVKQLITDWQTIEIGGSRVANNHADRAYDQKIIDRLGALHERAPGWRHGLEGRQQRCRHSAGISQSEHPSRCRLANRA